ncbi:hypothetical protein OZX61_12845 (plasmid) [Acinetobacter sp. ESL0695]|uniref:plasmid mobilization protein n=1 Tax=Acinetobacter sp. ESL0695 TaxID=2983215 RepID=UPI0023F3C3FA|nr:hypothetical protein [Acinetobacter sp. ESL0695]WEV50229.1 hypothetical protein OZX61_12845 [Acinetobacter sp. ESL0695]
MTEKNIKRPRVLVPSYWLPHEKESLEIKAKECNMSVSNYLRERGLGFQPKSKLDAQVGLSLMKVNADQARLGNLLKQYMSKDGQHLDNAKHRKEVNTIISNIAVAQIELIKIVRSLK